MDTVADYVANPEMTRGAAADLWRKTLSRISTHFGRLVFVASLRDSLSGRYSHPPLSQIVGGEVADRTLCHSHYEIFSQWLGFTLVEQKADLDEYLAESNAPLFLSHYREVAPATAHQVERQLYLTDLETLLELRRFEHGAAYSAPKA
jgi:hypothetical protein